MDDDDLSRLDAYLSSGESPEDCMMLSDLDGFLHGVVCSPVTIPVAEWMTKALGGTGGQVPAWVAEVVGNRFVEILDGLMNSPPDVEPIFWEAKGKHSRRAVWLLSGQNVYRVSLWTHTKTLAVFKFCRSLIPAVVGVGRMTRKSASLRKVMAVA